MLELHVKSTIDGSLQPSLWHKAAGNGPKPLLVGLHTWSFDRTNQCETMLPMAEALGWNLLLPEFRGPNLVGNPNGALACGSTHAKQDILDIVDYVSANFEIDEGCIYLLGGSGGGHMALLMAAFRPKVWKAVASFCPITDLAKWYYENTDYAPHIGYCCGGKPENGSMKEYMERSPVAYIDKIAESNVKIFHGRFDQAVPFTHSMDLYCRLSCRYPKSRVFIEVFDGGHELRIEDAKRWFLAQNSEPEKEGSLSK